jgi:hypothetical protein
MAFAYLTTEVYPDACARCHGCRRPDRPGFGSRLDLAGGRTGADRVLLRSRPPVRGRPAPRNRHRRPRRSSRRRAGLGNGLVRGHRPRRRQDRDDPDRGRLLRHARAPRVVRRAARSRSARGRACGDRRPERSARAGRPLRLSRDPESGRRAGVPRPAALPAGCEPWRGRATRRRWGSRASSRARACACGGAAGGGGAIRAGRCRPGSACEAASTSPSEATHARSFWAPAAGPGQGATASRAQAGHHSGCAGQDAQPR